jgi:hypothetical protein
MLDMYGLGDVARRPDGGAACRKGVRIVQLYYSKGDPWDAHADIMAHNDAFGFTMWPEIFCTTSFRDWVFWR